MLMQKEDIDQLFESLIEALGDFQASDTVLGMVEDARYEFETENDLDDVDED